MGGGQMLATQMLLQQPSPVFRAQQGPPFHGQAPSQDAYQPYQRAPVGAVEDPMFRAPQTLSSGPAQLAFPQQQQQQAFQQQSKYAPDPMLDQRFDPRFDPRAVATVRSHRPVIHHSLILLSLRILLSTSDQLRTKSLHRPIRTPSLP